MLIASLVLLISCQPDVDGGEHDLAPEETASSEEIEIAETLEDFEELDSLEDDLAADFEELENLDLE